MNNSLKTIVLAVFLTIALLPAAAMAHQPRLVTGDAVDVHNPEVSQAFYGELRGAQVEYRIDSDREFRLYVGILVPDIPEVRKDISAEIYRVIDGKKETVAHLDGTQFEWTPFFEEYAKDNYFWGPEFSAEDSQKGKELKGRTVPAGTYLIKVFSPDNHGKYSLVIGDLEEFPLKEIINAAVTVPRVKAQFFGNSPLTILASPFGWGYVLALYILAFIAGLLYRTLLKRFARGTPHARVKNIGVTDRLMRVGLGLALFVWAITTSWSPLLLFFSGFCVFEAIFSWCGLYAAFGRNTCPIA